ncbi:MAG: DUF3160 domain-containing protein [Chloroflexota bacterium]
MMKSKKGAYLLLVVLLFNLVLAACGDSSPAAGTPVAAGTGAILPGVGLASTPNTGTTSATTGAEVTPPAAATTLATSSVTVTTLATTTAARPTITTGAVATPTESGPPLERYASSFASYKEAAVKVKPSLKPYTVAANLSNVVNLADFKLSDAQKKLLVQNYFAIEPADFKQFFQAYESFRYDQIPTFVTTDSVAHVYHLLFDKLLRDTETKFLISDLNTLNRALFEAAIKQYEQVKGTTLQEAAKRVVGFVTVARKLGNPKETFQIPAYVADTVNAELKLIEAKQGFALSPVMGSDYQEDYSQYAPRGHYTKTEEQQNYFRSMIWYGRMTFRLLSDSETQSALLLMQALLNGQADGRKASDLWFLIYEPTAFFVGSADDLTYQDYLNVAKKIWGDAVSSDPKLFADTTKLAAFKKATDALPPPKVNSQYTLINSPLTREQQTKGLRLIGQRFTIDAYIFQSLIWREVGTDAKKRDLPKGLDILAALGSSEALKLLEQDGETQYQNYTTQFQKVKSLLATTTVDTWTQNLYWAWIYSLKSFAEVKGEGYPKFMQGQAWQYKNLITGLASWTELKHDTLLYAKQVYAERGGGPEELPTGYVEPEPVYYARMAALVNMTRQGLQQRNLIEKEQIDLLTRLEESLLTLKSISEKELAGQSISDTEKNFIAYWGATIESYTLAAADADGDGRKYIDKQDAAVVADVATGLQQVLEEGTGRVNLIYVAVEVNGKVQLTKGAVYSQYEFKVSPSQRMTDEAWQQQLNAGKAPPLENWKKSIQAEGLPKPQP